MYPNTINLVTLNVCGLRDDKKLSLLAHWYHAHRISVLYLQETNLGLDDLSMLCKYFPNNSIFISPGTNHSCGVITVVSEPSLNKSSNEGRLLIVDILVDSGVYRITNVYAPNNVAQRLAFFAKTQAIHSSSHCMWRF